MAKDIKKFDTVKKPLVPNPMLMPVEWIGTAALTLPVGGKVTKINCEGLEAPYLLLSSHASFVDFALAVKAVFPARTGWVISIEEFNNREWMMRNIGGIYKRKFTSDLTVVRHILHVLRKQKQICTMYPEARFSLCGVNERLDPSLGKLVKVAKCPVAVLIEHGSFLRSPQWCKHPYRKVPVSAEMTQVVTAEEALTLSAEEIQSRIEDAFHYDEYRWQYANRIVIDSGMRANGLHRVLYQCPHCGTEFRMNSEGIHLYCEECGSIWEMDVYGQLRCENGEDIFPMVPDWYRWERENVRKEVEEGKYHFEDDVRVEYLQNAKQCFRTIGIMHLTHGEDGFTVEGTTDDGKPFRLHRTVLSMYSCHIEYDFKGRGDAIDLATLTDTWFVFPLNAVNCLTKLHFAAEELHDRQARAEEAKAEAERRKKEETAAAEASAAFVSVTPGMTMPGKEPEKETVLAAEEDDDAEDVEY